MGVPSTGLTSPGTSGPFSTVHTTVGLLPTSGDPTLTIVVPTIPPFIPEGNGPCTHVLVIPTIPVTIPTIKSQTYQPLVTHGNYTLPLTNTISSPSQSTFGYILSFMSRINLPELEWLTNDLIHHNPLWNPIATKLTSYIPKF